MTDEEFERMLAGLPEGNQQAMPRQPVASSASRPAFRAIPDREEDSFLKKAGRFAMGFGAGYAGRGDEYLESLENKRKQKDMRLLQATALDARAIQQAIQSENMPKAVDVLVDRMNLLEQMGEDTSDTKMLRDALIGGRPDIVMGEINTFLGSLPKQTIDPKMITGQGQMVTQRLGGDPTAQSIQGYEPSESYRPMTTEERTLYNIPEGVPSRINIQTGKPETMGSGGVNINTAPESPAFSERMRMQAMESFIPTRDMINEQRQAIATFGKVEQMANSLNANDMTGAERIMRSMAPELSTALADPEGLLSTAEALRTQVAPQMRVAGSGSTSDIEFKAYLNSLPSLIQSDKGRLLLVESFRPAQDRALEKIELARKFATGQITIQQYIEQDLALDEGGLYSDEMKRRINQISGKTVFDLGDVRTVQFNPPSDGSIRPVGDN